MSNISHLILDVNFDAAKTTFLKLISNKCMSRVIIVIILITTNVTLAQKMEWIRQNARVLRKKKEKRNEKKNNAKRSMRAEKNVLQITATRPPGNVILNLNLKFSSDFARETRKRMNNNCANW